MTLPVPTSQPGPREIAEELILEAARSLEHTRIRVRVAGLTARLTDEQCRQIDAIEAFVARAVLSVDFQENGDE